ncbi:MAG: glycoside hydrolase family 3 N-terminal domain-containing protein, partial [Anaerolineales bacterium]|nr:glycoside hydrolase family 3 N-terminal domain-containing protein [Anaerolineales bacterium]
MKILLVILTGLFILVYAVYYKREIRPEINTRHNLSLLGEEAPILKEGETTFRDLNKNGKLDPYEDPRRSLEERVENLLSQMTLEEKAGMMFQTMIGMNDDGTLQEKGGLIPMPQSSHLIASRLMNHFNVLQTAESRPMAEWHNRIQKLAERTRLGIPITISSDPRHAFTQNLATSMLAGKFSQFPEQTGLAATRDVELVQQFADIARQEYLAVGIRLALHPMADLSTEPRWSRANGTFGEDADLASEMIAAYIRGFQGELLNAQSVACMTKHFPGAGPQKDGEDAHFPYGREQVYLGGQFEYHLKPFEAAFRAGTAQIMPYYGMPVGLPLEKVGFGFNKDVITGLLREKYGFDGVVCTDWMLVNPVKVMGRELIPAKAWGVEHLSVAGRIQKAIEAGVDQFGGEACPEVIVELVRSGRIKEERIDQSVRRLLRDKFRLGLFDNPYVDPDVAEQTVGKPEFRKVGELAQRKSIVLLKNDEGILPLKDGLKIYVENINPETASQYGRVVKNLADADVAILRLNAPYEKRKGLLESYFH